MCALGCTPAGVCQRLPWVWWTAPRLVKGLGNAAARTPQISPVAATRPLCKALDTWTLGHYGTAINTRIHAPARWQGRFAPGLSATQTRFGNEPSTRAPFSAVSCGCWRVSERRVIVQFVHHGPSRRSPRIRCGPVGVSLKRRPASRANPTPCPHTAHLFFLVFPALLVDPRPDL